MTSVPKHLRESHWRHNTTPAKRDPAAEQLHRDRITALVVLGIMAAVFAALIALAVFSGAPASSDMIDPWMMMP